MRIPLKLYVNEITCREWSVMNDTDSSKCYELEITYPDQSEKSFSRAIANYQFKINYLNRVTGMYLDDSKIIEITKYVNGIKDILEPKDEYCHCKVNATIEVKGVKYCIYCRKNIKPD